MSARKGSKYERQLVNHLADLGLGVLRVPASGGRSARHLPDILIGKPAPWATDDLATVQAVELKAGKAKTLYVDAEEVAALEDFANDFGARPYLVARFTTQASPTAFYFVKPERARRTDGGNFGLPLADIDERATMQYDP